MAQTDIIMKQYEEVKQLPTLYQLVWKSLETKIKVIQAGVEASQRL